MRTRALLIHEFSDISVGNWIITGCEIDTNIGGSTLVHTRITQKN